MIHQLSMNLANILKNHLHLEEKDLDQYSFGIEVFLVILIKWTGLLGIGILIGQLPEAFVFTVAFTLLRNRAGGIHSESLLKCFIITAFLMIGSLSAVKIIPQESKFLLTILLMTFASILVFIYAPVDTPNKPLNEEEKVIYRKQSRCIILVISVLTLSFSLINSIFLSYGTIISLSCFLEAMTLPIGVWERKKASIEA